MQHQTCIILAAGKSQRFPSPLGKMQYPFIQKPLLDHVIEKASVIFEKIIVVISESLESWFHLHYNASLSQISYVIQPDALGTWNALCCALPCVTTEICIVLNGDMPLVSAALLKTIAHCPSSVACVITQHPYPKGYGRIIRNSEGTVQAIVEERDLTPLQHGIGEVNAGLYKFNTDVLKTLSVEKSNSCHEWYLTDLWKAASPFVQQTQFIVELDYRCVQGVNTWMDYECAEQWYYQLQRENLVRQGALLQNCKDIYASGTVLCQPLAVITGPCILKGTTTVATEAHLHPYSYIENITIDCQAQIGPFAKIGEGSHVGSGACLGSFIEVKRSVIGAHSKAKHFSYMADTTLGTHCNLGAFVVTCNYDGTKKHRTQIGNDVFVGSATQLIAPIALADHCYIGAGTTLTRSVASHTLITRRSRIKSRPYLKKGKSILCAELSQD